MKNSKREKKRADAESAPDTVEGKEQLLAQIRRHAEEEADEEFRKAEKTAEQKKESAKGKAERIRREAEERAANRIAQIKENNASAIELQKKRIRLRHREDQVNDILSTVREKCHQMIEDEEYPNYVKGWIKEAVLGLDTDTAVISTSEREQQFITKDLLETIEKEIQNDYGKCVTIEMDEQPARDQGVVARSKDGRLEYSNLIESRIHRNHADIRRMIYRTLYGKGEK
jgi:V/A-type H+/Na+-transporting ATPase subunit E